MPYFRFHEIDSGEVFKIIESLKVKKSAGYDNISARVIKENKMTLTPILTELINLSLNNSVFPDCLKVAKITPIFKKGVSE